MNKVVHWTPEQIEKLKVSYPTGERIEALSAQLKHSPLAIKTLASRLNVRRGRRQVPKYANRDSGPLLAHLSDAERGYIAGLFDGEGTVGILTRGNALNVAIANTDPRVMEWLVSRIPQGVVNAHEPRGRERLRQYKFRLSTIPGAKFCAEIASLLVIKRAEAELVGEALRAGFAPLSHEQRVDLRNALHTLKTGSTLTPMH